MVQRCYVAYLRHEGTPRYIMACFVNENNSALQENPEENWSIQYLQHGKILHNSSIQGTSMFCMSIDHNYIWCSIVMFRCTLHTREHLWHINQTPWLPTSVNENKWVFRKIWRKIDPYHYFTMEKFFKTSAIAGLLFVMSISISVRCSIVLFQCILQSRKGTPMAHHAHSMTDCYGH